VDDLPVDVVEMVAHGRSRPLWIGERARRPETAAWPGGCDRVAVRIIPNATRWVIIWLVHRARFGDVDVPVSGVVLEPASGLTRRYYRYLYVSD
jgi:hypothetical protein